MRLTCDMEMCSVSETANPSAASRSLKKRAAKQLPPVPAVAGDDALMTAREGAALARIGLSTFWKLVREGRLPPPAVRIMPNAPRWRLRDLRAALEGAA